jgi:hypothetical protein
MTERSEPWTIKELAEAADVDASYIRRLCIQGKIQGARKPARDWLIPAQVGEEWLEERHKRFDNPFNK